jgi:hypothetical protein
MDCISLESVTIGNNVTTIGIGAFWDTGLTSVAIPNSVTTIAGGAFYGSSLTSIDLDSDNQHFYFSDGLLYNKAMTTIILALQAVINDNFVIPDSVTTIGDTAFSGCTGLTSIIIPDSVTTIGVSAFSNCTGLMSIIIPDSVTTIGNGAFSGCTGLTSVTIGNSVITIGNWAFLNCISLTSVTFQGSGSAQPTILSSVFGGTANMLRIYVPVGSAAAYRINLSLNSWINRIHSTGCALPNAGSGASCSCL